MLIAINAPYYFGVFYCTAAVSVLHFIRLICYIITINMFLKKSIAFKNKLHKHKHPIGVYFSAINNDFKLFKRL